MKDVNELRKMAGILTETEQLDEGVRYTKQHFEDIASVISSLRDKHGHEHPVIKDLVDKLGATFLNANASYKHDIFVKATKKSTKK